MKKNRSPWLHQLRQDRARKTLTTDLTTDIAIVGGGIAEKAEFLLQKAARSARKEILSEDSARALTVRKAKLGSYAGAIGAALFIKSDNNYIIDKLK